MAFEWGNQVTILLSNWINRSSKVGLALGFGFQQDLMTWYLEGKQRQYHKLGKTPVTNVLL